MFEQSVSLCRIVTPTESPESKFQMTVGRDDFAGSGVVVSMWRSGLTTKMFWAFQILTAIKESIRKGVGEEEGAGLSFEWVVQSEPWN